MMLFSPFRDNAPAGCISAKFSGLWSDLKTLSTLRLPPIPEQPIPHCPTKFLLHRLDLKLGKALKVAGLTRENRQLGGQKDLLWKLQSNRELRCTGAAISTRSETETQYIRNPT